MVDWPIRSPARSTTSIRPAPTSARSSYGERDEYTNLAWLAGTAALQQLGRPADAARHVRPLRPGGASRRRPGPRASTGRRARRIAAGQSAQSQRLSRAGGRQPGPVLRPARARAARPAGPAAAGRRRHAVRGASAPPSTRGRSSRRPGYLGQMGQWSDQTLFVRALAEQRRERPRPRARQPSSAARSAGPTSASGWRARRATKGADLLLAAGFPGGARSRRPIARHWALAHGIMRQESSFDRAAVSRAGARGMMQLMPGTAREQARQARHALRARPADRRSRLQHHARHQLFRRGCWTNGAAMRRWRWRATMPAPATSAAGCAPTAIRACRASTCVDWIEDIPFSETRNYVQRVLENAVVYDAIEPAAAASRLRTGANRLSPTYLGEQPAGLDPSVRVRQHDRSPELHHARRLSARCARNMRPCSRASGRSWSRRSPGRRPMATGPRMPTINMAAGGCARSTGGSIGCRGG